MAKKPDDDVTRGETGATGETGARGARGPKGATGPPVDNLDLLLREVEKLSGQVTLVRDEARGAKEALREKTRWGWIIASILALGLLLNLIIGSVALNAASDVKSNTDHDRTQAVKTDERIQASLVGICATVNVNRITNQNMLAEINTDKPFDLNDNWPAFRDKWRANWAPLNCRALVNDEIGVQLCLQYPETIDPATGKPVPTTIDPINEKACPK